MQIRDENPGDEHAIHALTAAAFDAVEFSDGSEPFIIDALRETDDLSLSLVAVDGHMIIGHVAFSPVKVAGLHDSWFGLGPISVIPDRQKQRVGSKLIHEGLKRLRRMNAKACLLVGDPAYYSRFGFEAGTGLTYGPIDTRYIQRLLLGGTDRQGEVTYSPAFDTKPPTST